MATQSRIPQGAAVELPQTAVAVAVATPLQECPASQAGSCHDDDVSEKRASVTTMAEREREPTDACSLYSLWTAFTSSMYSGNPRVARASNTCSDMKK